MRRFIGLFVGLCVLVPTVSWSQALPWDAGFEADPAVNDPVSEGDDRIREMRSNIRYRDEVEHWFGPTGAVGDNGIHRDGAGKCFMGTAFPTTLSDGMSDFDNTGLGGDTDLDNMAANSAGGDRDDIGDGRCFIDIDGPDNLASTDDDYTMYIFEGQAGDAGCPAPAAITDCWHEVVANSPFESSDDEILAGSYNLIFNGSFEATNGTGAHLPGLAAGLFATAGPSGWADGGGTTPFYSYVDASTDTRYGDGYHLVLENNGAANEAVQQTLTNLSSDTIYKVLARVQDDGVAANVLCRLDVVNEGGAVFTAQDSSNAAGPVWETLSDTFGTSAGVVDTVDVIIYSIGANGQECLVDHVAVYEVGDTGTDRDEISEPGVIPMQVSDNGIAAVGGFGAVPGLELQFTPPTPGYVVQVGFTINAEGDNTPVAHMECRLDDNVTGDLVTTAISSRQSGNAGQDHVISLTNIYINPDPTPGVTYTYTVECSDPAGVMDYNQCTGCAAAATYSNLWLMAYPAR